MDQVEQVRSKSDIVEVVGSRITLKKAGRNHRANCPFHSEKTPSFMVSSERQTFKCFGCGEGGDVFTFLQKYEGMSFLEALEYLAQRSGIRLESYKPTRQDLEKKRLLELLHLAGEYYQWILQNHKSAEQAREYIKKRKITSESQQRFMIGYAPDQWRSVSDYLINKRKYTIDELESVGMVIKSAKGHYDRFRDRIIFPLKDHKGAIVGFSGRVLPPGDEKSAKYINSPETRLYSKSKMLYGLWENREYVRKDNRIVLTEGELDVIGSYQAGIKSVVAIKGSAFTEEQARLIARYTKNIIMALDADQAGEDAIKRAVKVAEEMDMSIRVVQIVGGKDPGDVSSEDPKQWRDLVKRAVTYYDFLIEVLFAANDADTGEGARVISRELIPTLADISNLVVRAHYVKVLSLKLAIPESSIYEEIERVEKKRELKDLKKEVKKIEIKKETRREKIEEFFLALTLQYYNRFGSQLDKVNGEWFSLPSIKKIVEALKKWDERDFEIKKFVNLLPFELHEMIDRAYLKDVSSLAENDTVLRKEYEKVIGEVEEQYLRERIKVLSKRIAKTEKTGSESNLEELKKEFTQISKLLANLG